jgi:tetraacyldisaccharide 4'-kinase
MPFLKYLLLPFAGLYNVVTRLRNHLYDVGHKKSFQFDSVVISVGNLNVGGSGKTPMIEYLIRLLSDRYVLATLSRGYGRKTKGFHIASQRDDAHSIGDEPYQLFRKFGDKVTVVVGEERALAIPTILNERPEVQVILMDDAFQHRAVVPQFSILVTDYEKPFYKDFLMPLGRLREARIGAARAHTVVVTKCPPTGPENESKIRNELHGLVGNRPIFFSSMNYQSPTGIGHNNPISMDVVLVSGIAKNAPLEREVAKHFKIHRHMKFPDHHAYTVAEIENIHQTADLCNVDSILTTEKDMVKLIGGPLFNMVKKKNWFYIPIQATFLKNGSDFDEMVIRLIDDKLKEANLA